MIADYMAGFDDPATVAAWLSAATGVVEHGLFPPAMVAEVIAGIGDRVERFTYHASE